MKRKNKEYATTMPSSENNWQERKRKAGPKGRKPGGERVSGTGGTHIFTF